MKMRRKGLGIGLGQGYKNLVPMDSYIHGLSAKGMKTKYKVTAVALDRETRQQISEPRTEIIDTETNSLFTDARDEQDVKERYEAFWDINPESEEVVKVIDINAKGASPLSAVVPETSALVPDDDAVSPISLDAHGLTAVQAIRKAYGESKNFMTPNVIRYGFANPTRAYELSSGKGIYDETIYGVSVVDINEDGSVKKRHDLSSSFQNKTEAEYYIRESLPTLQARGEG